MSFRYKSDQWLAPEDVQLTVGSVNIGSATVYNAAGASWIGLASVSGNVVNSTGANYIGLASVNISPIPTGASWVGLASVSGVVGLQAGTAKVGFATVNVAELAAGANYIGLASVNVSPIPAGASWIGLVTTHPGAYCPSSNGLLTSNSTVLVKNGAGLLHVLNSSNISTPTVCVYDALTPTGTPVFTLAPGVMGSWLLDLAMSTGITLNCQGAVTPLVQVSYK